MAREKGRLVADELYCLPPLDDCLIVVLVVQIELAIESIWP